MLLLATVNTYESYTQEELDGLNAAIRSEKKYSFKENPEERAKGYLNYNQPVLLDVLAAKRALGSRHEIVVTGIPSESEAWTGILMKLERLETLVSKLSVAEVQEQAFNARVNVHVPGLGLLLLNEVTVQYDLCTDKLQRELDAGWRILAVCPQPDQRRPDYVLGRTTSTT